MVRINRVYTRTGDEGTTRLVGGQVVPKTDLRIEAYGTVDEVNAAVGMARVALAAIDDAAARRLEASAARVQQQLFDLGSELACLPEDVDERLPRLEASAVEALEAEMDRLNEALPPLSSFVLPGGGAAGAAFHLARTVCRRAERAVLRLHAVSPVRPVLRHYLNRLSDWLFVAGRVAARAAGCEELLWVPGGSASGESPSGAPSAGP